MENIACNLFNRVRTNDFEWYDEYDNITQDGLEITWIPVLATTLTYISLGLNGEKIAESEKFFHLGNKLASYCIHNSDEFIKGVKKSSKDNDKEFHDKLVFHAQLFNAFMNLEDVKHDLFGIDMLERYDICIEQYYVYVRGISKYDLDVCIPYMKYCKHTWSGLVNRTIRDVWGKIGHKCKRLANKSAVNY
jgi:predicted transcriptional regulator YdeE